MDPTQIPPQPGVQPTVPELVNPIVTPQSPLVEPQPILQAIQPNNQPTMVQPGLQPIPTIQPTTATSEPLFMPQPSVVPQQPYTQPTVSTTMPMQPLSYSTMNSGSKKKKLLVMGASIAAAGLVIVVGFLAFNKFMGVTKEDYRQASETVNEASLKLSSTYSAISSLAYRSGTTETQVTNNVDTAKKAIDEYKVIVIKIGSEKALKNGDVKKQYNAFINLNDKYLPIIDSYNTSAGQVLVPITKCTKTLNDTSTSATAATVAANLKGCVTLLDAVKNVSDSDLQKLVTETTATFKEVAALVEQLNATPTSNYKLRSELRTKYYDAFDAYQDKVKDVDSNITKKLKDSDPANALNTLSSTIFKLSLGK